MTMHRMKNIGLYSAWALMLFAPLSLHAQDADATAQVEEDVAVVAEQDDADVAEETVEQLRQSIFFSFDELDTILQAAQGNAPAVDGDDEDASDETAEQVPVDRGRRVLTLSGVVYQSPQDWTIWLNGERVTPKNIPENVRGLIVQTDHIRLRWLDKAENRIVNVTLRPHQQYNLDLDTIFPGTR